MFLRNAFVNTPDYIVLSPKRHWPHTGCLRRLLTLEASVKHGDSSDFCATPCMIYNILTSQFCLKMMMMMMMMIGYLYTTDLVLGRKVGRFINVIFICLGSSIQVSFSILLYNSYMGVKLGVSH